MTFLRLFVLSICGVAAAGCTVAAGELPADGTGARENVAVAEGALTPPVIAVTTPNRRDFTVSGSGFTPGESVYVTARGTRSGIYFRSVTLDATLPSSACSRTMCWPLKGGALPVSIWTLCEHPEWVEDIVVTAIDANTGVSSNTVVIRPSLCGT